MTQSQTLTGTGSVPVAGSGVPAGAGTGYDEVARPAHAVPLVRLPASAQQGSHAVTRRRGAPLGRLPWVLLVALLAVLLLGGTGVALAR